MRKLTTLRVPRYCRVKQLAKICKVPVKQVMQSLVKRRHKRFFISEEKYVFRTKNAIILPFDVSSKFVESNLNYEGDKKTKLHSVVVEEDTCDPIDIMNELLDKEGSLRHGDQLPKHVETHATLPPTVVVLGERDHGKTSLVNALTGRRVRDGCAAAAAGAAGAASASNVNR